MKAGNWQNETISGRKVWWSNPRVREGPMVKRAIFSNCDRKGKPYLRTC